MENITSVPGFDGISGSFHADVPKLNCQCRASNSQILQFIRIKTQRAFRVLVFPLTN